MPLSLAATDGIYVISFPLATEMFHFARCTSDLHRISRYEAGWVSPFGHLRIKAR